MPKSNAQWKSKYFRVGGYSFLLSLGIIVILIILNLLVSALPTTLTKFDISPNQLYSISDDTKSLVEKIDRDVTVYLIAESGTEDNLTVELLRRYTAINNRIHVQYVDPVIHPAFYAGYFSEQPQENSLIVESDLRFKVVPYDTIYLQTYLEDGTVTTSDFAGESAVTSALDYVTAERIPKLYQIGGHGELALGTALSKYLSNDNYDIAALSLSEEIPADADCLILHVPSSDLSEEEIEYLRAYVNEGGNLIVVTMMLYPHMEHLYDFLNTYNMRYIPGLIVEGNASRYMTGYPYYLLPNVEHNAITERLGTDNLRVMLPMSHGIEILDQTDTEVQSLFYTSASSYAKTNYKDVTTNYEKAEGDAEGPFCVGALATHIGGGHILWLPTTYMLDAMADYYVNGGNSNYFLTVLSMLCDKKASVSIATKSMQVELLTVSGGASTFWMLLTCIAMPCAVLLIGIAIWYKRRKR